MEVSCGSSLRPQRPGHHNSRFISSCDGLQATLSVSTYCRVFCLCELKVELAVNNEFALCPGTREYLTRTSLCGAACETRGSGVEF